MLKLYEILMIYANQGHNHKLNTFVRQFRKRNSVCYCLKSHIIEKL